MHSRTHFSLLATLVSLAFAIPVCVVALSLFQADGGAWAHIRSTTLNALIGDSLALAVMVASGVAIIGTLTAWLCARYDFFARRQLEWLLVLPLAMPAYVMAYAYTDLLQYAGPLQTAMREMFGWQSKADYWFFEIRSLGGAATILSFALYPYVYLLARVAFLEQSTSLQEAGRTFGYGRAALFFRVSLPLARPAIVAGVALAMMETLADYGTVSYFGVNTFTTGIFSAWFAQGDRIAAAKLATMLLMFVALLLIIEGWARSQAKFNEARGVVVRRQRLHGSLAALALFVTAIPVIGGFLLPLFLLTRLAFDDATTTFAFASVGEFAHLAWNSFSLATATAIIAVAISLILAYAKRSHAGWPIRLANRAVGLGYAVPGTVIAVGVLIPVTMLDHRLADAASALIGRETGLLLTGGVMVLIYAYLIRFMAISLQTVEAGFSKITPSMDDAARSLGLNNRGVVRQIHAPLLKTSLITAGLMVFVDVMKELPATLVMRPFDFDTLAVRTYIFAKDERLGEAAVAALVIVLVGLIPVVFASRAITKGNA
jgi:iron(III) transport system permease protein